MGPKSITGIHIEGDSETQCHRGETMADGARDWSDVSAGQGALRTASNHQKLEDVSRILPLELSDRARPCQNLNFRFLASRIVKEYIFVVLRHPACGNLFWQLWEMNTLPPTLPPASPPTDAASRSLGFHPYSSVAAQLPE